MVAQAKKGMSVKKRVLILIGLVLAAPIVYIALYLITSPIFNIFDKNKFTQHDNQGKSLFAELKAASGGIDDWKYEAKCTDANAGKFGPIEPYCGIDLRLDAKVGSAEQFRSLHEKYFNIIDQQKFLKAESSLSINPAFGFGSNMVKSTAEKQYSAGSNFDCRYIAKMYDSDDEESAFKQAGASISGSDADVYMNFTCSDWARDNWYNSKLY